jgi:SAM-dependent methyltransferase
VKSPSETISLFDEICNYWEEIADSRPTQEQVNFVKEKIDPSGLFLDLGCGNGRHTVPLSKTGYCVIGLDVSPCLLQAAKQKAIDIGKKATLVRADMRHLPFRTKTFTAVISLDTSFGYVPTHDSVQQILGEIAQTLTGNGVFLLDIFNQERVLQLYSKNFFFRLRPFLFRLIAHFSFLRRLSRWREYSSFWMLQQRSVVENGNRLRDIWVFRDKRTGKVSLAEHAVWLYSLKDLDALLLKAGFQIQDVYGNYERAEFRKDSNRLIVISHKTDPSSC